MKTLSSLKLRPLELEDIEDYREMTHPSRAYHKYNGPYYKHDNEEEHEEKIRVLRSKLESGEKNVLGNKEIIADATKNEIIGLVNWYWKSEETNWLEVGIVIFNENYWGCGVGYKALSMWIDKMFERKEALVRIGLTTWSGNVRMMKLAEKMGLKKEAEYRKARIVEGVYYDSVSYGVLKEEWERLKRKL
ncbi:GNAT family N-acetyltransferase [Fusibacter sp. JL216-2]|uniref:GNAT family N-acetyltransferase n=1 Tax=Fusibacter sp. JL216-2 TaxID=3071453 RepID=UPI003D32ABA6